MSVWKVFNKMTKKKGNKLFIVVYVGEQDGENTAEVCFEDNTKEDEMKDVFVVNIEVATVKGDAVMYEDPVFDE